MKPMEQLLRQPLKTLIGITLMTLATAIVCLCVGQALAARTTKAALNRRFSTVAIPLSDEYAKVPVRMDEEMLTWLEAVSAEHPDIVRDFVQHGILSAYIPELTPLNITAEQYDNHTGGIYNFQPAPYAMPYSCAMLVITLDEICEPQPVTYTIPTGEILTREDFYTDEDYVQWLNDPNVERVTATQGYTMELVGTITQVVSLESGYRSPEGRVARLALTATTLEELESYDLELGQKYIIYGMDYVDEYWKMIGVINAEGKYDHWSFWPYDPSLLRLLTDAEKEHFKAWADSFPDDPYLVSRLSWYAEYNGGAYLTKEQFLQLNAISITLRQAVPLIQYEQIRDEQTGALIELRAQDQVTYTDANGVTVTVSNDIYSDHYRVPTIAKLEGSVEDFLQSSEGALWQTALRSARYNNQAFAVIGVDKLGYLAEFAQEESKIVEGRDFTEEELAGGTRVCILYEALAQANGLQVGDTVTLNLYGTDYGLPYQGGISADKGLVNLSASFHFHNTEFVDAAQYTVVGICRGETVFPDVAENEYAFSANTVFVPRSSVAADMETRPSVSMNILVMQNGQLERFHELALASGFGGCFRYNDQGYSTIAANFHNYEQLGRQILLIGAVVYVVLLLLFLLLYPGSMKRNMRTMQSFGATFLRRFAHVMASSAGIILPASVLGGCLGTLLWDQMVETLQNAAASAVALQIEAGALMAVTAAQLIFALILTVFVAIAVAAPKGMSDRR